MRALLYDTALRFSTDAPQPDAPQSEALILVLLAGICNTDLEITRGYVGGSSRLGHGILGHEFVGVAQEAGDPSWIGRRVVGEINCACRICPTCLRGDVPVGRGISRLRACPDAQRAQGVGQAIAEHRTTQRGGRGL